MTPRWIIVSLLFVAGCGGLRIDREVHPGANDWTQFGHNPSRVAESTERLALPLQELWRQDINAGVGNGSPVVADSIVLVGNLKGELHAIDANSGKKTGYIALGEAIPGSPAIVPGNVVVVTLANTRESLQLFDLTTGKTRWRKSVGDVESSPLVSGPWIFTAAINGTVICSAIEDGTQSWKYEIPDNTTLKGFRSSPAISGTTLIIGGDDGYVYALNVVTGKQMWRTATGSSIAGSPVIDSGKVFAGNIHGEIFAIDLSTGKMVWHVSAGAPVYGSLAVARGLVIAGDLSGSVFAWRTSDGIRAWSTNVKGLVNSGAAVADTVAFVGTLGRSIFGLSTNDGAIVWSAEVGGRIKSPPVIAEGRLYVVTDEREVICFTGTTP